MSCSLTREATTHLQVGEGAHPTGHVVRGFGVGESPGEDNAGSGPRGRTVVSGVFPELPASRFPELQGARRTGPGLCSPKTHMVPFTSLVDNDAVFFCCLVCLFAF